MENKTNSIEQEARVELCLEKMLIDRIKYADYLTWAKDKYGISRNAANNIWTSARELRREYFKDSIEDNIITAITELENLELRAQQHDDASHKSVELKAKEIKYKIQGLFKERYEVEHKGVVELQWGS